MEIYFAIVTGALYAIGLFLMLQRSLVRLVIGLAILSHGANLLIFTTGRVTRGRAPLIGEDGAPPPEMLADPLPQALILTAIVISFAVLGFSLVLARRACLLNKTDDVDAMRATES